MPPRLQASALAAAFALALSVTSPLRTARAQAPSFELDIRAPEPIASALTRHLELGRYQAVTDLDEAELARLLVLAERDTRRLLASLGYFNPQVYLSTDTAPRPPRVTLRVEPGTAAQVVQVDIGFAGAIADTSDPQDAAQRERLHEAWLLPPGQLWTQSTWEAAQAQTLRGLVAQRYLRGRIANSLADIDAFSGRVQLQLQLDSGPRFRYGPLQVTGLRHYDPRLVPRLVRLTRGADYDQEHLAQARQRLTDSGYFDSALIVVSPQSDPEDAPVQIDLREAPLQRVEFGLGLTTDRGPRAWLEHRHNRVPGVGWRAQTRVVAERRAPLAETEWTAPPDEDNWRWGVLASLQRTHENDQVTRASRLRVGRLLTGEPIDRHLYIQLDRARVSDQGGLPPQDTGDGSALTAHYRWTQRDFDQLTMPTRGHGLTLEAGAGLTLSSQRTPFQRTVLRWLQMRPVDRDRLVLRAEAGAVLARAGARIPATQLFLTGGDTTVRGYRFHAIGVERDDGTPHPGRFLAVGSIEWQAPLSSEGAASAWTRTLFVDAGAVADRASRLRAQVGLGTGLRYASLVGPIQVDLAYGVKARRLRLHLNLGARF